MLITTEFLHRQLSRSGFCLIPIVKGLKCPPLHFPLASAFSAVLRDEIVEPFLTGDQDVAVILGSPSLNLVVFDFDVSFIPAFMPETLTSRTKRGFHLYYRVSILPESSRLYIQGVKVCDLLSSRRMCKTPPSRFAGGVYRWEQRTPPLHLSRSDFSSLIGSFDPPPPPPPPQRLEISHPDRYLLAKIRGEIGNMDGSQKGCRNKTLVNCCVKLKDVESSLWKPHLTAAALRAGLSQTEIFAVFKWSDHLA